MALSKRWLACFDRPASSGLSDPLRVGILGWAFDTGATRAGIATEGRIEGRLSAPLGLNPPDHRVAKA